MHPLSRDLLSRTLRTPDSIQRFSMHEWDLLIRQARVAGLLSRLHQRFRAHDLENAIPLPVRWHFEAADTLAEKQRIAVLWELRQIRHALRDIPGPLIVLKGAAYVAAALPAASGRLFNYIDTLVPRAPRPLVASALLLARWHPAALS